MDTLSAGLSFATGISIFLLFLGLVSSIRTRQRSAERLQAYLTPAPTRDESDSALAGLLLDLDKWMGKRSFGASIARDLAQADIKLTVAEYVLLHLGLFAMGLLLGPLLLRSAPAGVLVACVLLILPRFYVSSAQHKRLNQFNEQLPSALNSLSNSLRGGYGLVQAMTLVATQMSTPMSTEFQRVVSEVGYGLPYDVAFQNMLRRNPSTDLSMVVTAIEINLEVGGNLSEILDNISAIIRDRVRIQGQIRAYTAQTRLSSTVLTILPFGLFGVMFLLNRGYISMLWTSTSGLALLALAGFLLGTGTILLRKIAQINV
jgi:tight adherence protein B